MIEEPKKKRAKETKKRRGRGEGSVHQRHIASCPKVNKKGERPEHSCKGPWVVAIDLGYVGKRHVRLTRTGKTKAEVLAKKKALESEIDKGGGLTEDITVEEWLEHWFEKIAPGRVVQRTLDGYRSYLNLWLIPYLGKYRLTKLNEDHVRSLYRAMQDYGSSDATRRQAHAILRRALEVATRERRIIRNPAGNIDAPKVPKDNHRLPLSIVHAKQILACLDGDPLAARWVASLLLGLRQGEALGLMWEDVNFEAGTIRIRHELIRLKGQGMVLTPPKSTSSIRTIPILEPMRYALKNTEKRGDYVFYGIAQNPRKDWQNWKELLVRSGVCPADMAFGDMPELATGRTTTGTLLRDAGVPDTVIRDILGHSQVQVTQENYMRTDALTMKKAMKALEASVAPAKKVTRRTLPHTEPKT